jgi:hypothetical protein
MSYAGVTARFFYTRIDFLLITVFWQWAFSSNLPQGCTNDEREVVMVTKFCTVAYVTVTECYLEFGMARAPSFTHAYLN